VVDFAQWLRSEVGQTKDIVACNQRQPRITNIVGANARLRALREVALAVRRRSVGDFDQWLRSEIEQARAIRKDQETHVFEGNPRPAMETVSYVNGRLRALREAQLAYERSTTNG
jgi:hypothetical protein